MTPATVRLLFTGPFVLLIFVSTLAVTAIVAAGFQRMEPLVTWAERASTRLTRGRAVPTLWGLAAGVVFAAASGLLLNIKPIALLGILAAFCSLLLIGLGTAVAAISLGRILAEAFGQLDMEGTGNFCLGLATLFFASLFPMVGWIVVGLIVASGLGAIIEAWVTRPRN